MLLLIMILAQIILYQVFGNVSIMLAAYDMAITRNEIRGDRTVEKCIRQRKVTGALCDT